jgi:hypothetical protein
MNLTEKQINYYLENGYLHLENFFEEYEIESFIKGCDKNEFGDTLVRIDFLEFSVSEKVVNVLKQLLQSEIIIYPGLSQTRTMDTCSIDDRFYHVDSHPDDLDYSKQYTVLNTGIYLQDHTKHSGGLKIKPGSHKYDCIVVKSISKYLKLITKSVFKLDFKTLYTLLRPSRSVNIKTKPRDFLIWNMRTHHSGYFVILKFFNKLSLPPILENFIPKFLKKIEVQNRRVVLSAYAAPSPYAEMWLKKQSQKERRQNHYLANEVLNNKYFKELFKKRGLVYRNDGYLNNKK